MNESGDPKSSIVRVGLVIFGTIGIMILAKVIWNIVVDPDAATSIGLILMLLSPLFVIGFIIYIIFNLLKKTKNFLNKDK